MKSIRASSSASGTKNVYDQTVNFVSTYGGQSGGSKATNDTALSAFNTAYAAFSGRTQLIIPPGDYDFTEAVWGSSGGDKLVISAYGATLRNQVGFVNSGQYNDNTHHANIQTIAAGNSTVTLVTAAQTSRFSEGQWCCVTEGDLQGFGYPSNPWKFEYKKIDSIGTGTLTFTEPLQKSYSSTFQNYSAGNGSDIYRGGPATVYAFNPIWNQEVEFKGAYITDTGGLFYGKCRLPTYTDMYFETYGPCPTVSTICTVQRCRVGTFGEMEVDKLCDTLVTRGNTFNAVAFQNIVNNLYSEDDRTNSGQYWRGSAVNSTIRNLTTDTYWFGTKGYGVLTGNTRLESCNAGAASYDTSYRFALADYSQPGSGALTITSNDPQTWAVPNGWYVILDGSGNFSGIDFQVTDIAFSGGVTTISTTLSTPVPGTAGGFSAPWYIHPHPGKNTTLITCTGNSVFTTASGNPANSPIFGWD
jgi:hypothetical protein